MKKLYGIASFLLVVVVVMSVGRCNATRRVLTEIQQYPVKAPVTDCQFLDDKRMLVLAGSGLSVWDVAAGEQLFELTDSCTTVCVSKHGILVGKTDGTVELYDDETTRLLHQYKLHSSMICALSISEDGRMLGTASGYSLEGGVQAEGDYSIKIVDAETGKTERKLSGHIAPIAQIKFLNKDSEILSLSNDGTLRRWDIDNEVSINVHGVAKPPKTSVIGGKKVITTPFFKMSLDVLDHGRIAALGSEIWDLDKWTVIQTFEIPASASVQVSKFVMGRDRLVTGYSNGEVAIWNIDDQTELHRLKVFANGAPIECVSLSPSGEQLIAGGRGTIAGFSAIPKGVRAEEPNKLRLYRLTLPKKDDAE